MKLTRSQYAFRFGLKIFLAYLGALFATYIAIIATGAALADRGTGRTILLEYNFSKHGSHPKDVFITPLSDGILHFGVMPVYALGALGLAWFLWKAIFPWGSTGTP